MEKFTLFLIGFSGSGKSTIGKILAQKLDAACYDIDSLIEKQEKMKIADIFTEKSESYFRECETKMINEVINKSRNKKIVSLGGGAFESKRNREMIVNNGLTIYLSCSQDELYKRMQKATDRPLLHNASDLKMKIKTMMQKRIKNYKKADHTVSTSTHTPAQVADKIIKEILCR